MKAKNRSTIGVMAAVLLALLAGYLLWQNGGDDTSDAAEAPVATQEVLVAVKALPSGMSAADLYENWADWVRVTEVAADQVTPGMLTSIDDLDQLGLGNNALVGPLTEGAKLKTSQFAVIGSITGDSVPVPENLFTITVALDRERALGGQILPGQYVAVVGLFAGGDVADDAAQAGEEGVMVVEHAYVTSVINADPLTQATVNDDPFAQAAQVGQGRYYVTLAVPVDDLETIAFTAKFHDVWLARQGDEASVKDSAVRNRGNVVVPVTED